MKLLALAASIALAVSTIGLGPAAANTLTTTEVLAAQEGAESVSDGAADPDVPGPPPDETASPDADEEGASKDGASDGAEESEAIDAGFTLEQTEMTAEEIGDPNQGIRYTVDSLKAGDVVTGEPLRLIRPSGGQSEIRAVHVDDARVFTAPTGGNTWLEVFDARSGELVQGLGSTERLGAWVGDATEIGPVTHGDAVVAQAALPGGLAVMILSQEG